MPTKKKKTANVLFVDDEGTTWGGCQCLHLVLPGDRKAPRLVDEAAENYDTSPDLPAIEPLQLFHVMRLLLGGYYKVAYDEALKIPGAKKIQNAHPDWFKPE